MRKLPSSVTARVIGTASATMKASRVPRVSASNTTMMATAMISSLTSSSTFSLAVSP